MTSLVPALLSTSGAVLAVVSEGTGVGGDVSFVGAASCAGFSGGRVPLPASALLVSLEDSSEDESSEGSSVLSVPASGAFSSGFSVVFSATFSLDSSVSDDSSSVSVERRLGGFFLGFLRFVGVSSPGSMTSSSSSWLCAAGAANESCGMM